MLRSIWFVRSAVCITLFAIALVPFTASSAQGVTVTSPVPFCSGTMTNIPFCIAQQPAQRAPAPLSIPECHKAPLNVGFCIGQHMLPSDFANPSIS